MSENAECPSENATGTIDWNRARYVEYLEWDTMRLDLDVPLSSFGSGVTPFPDGPLIPYASGRSLFNATRPKFLKLAAQRFH